MSPNKTVAFDINVEPCHTDMRLDQFISDKKTCSRSLAASLVKQGLIRVNGRTVKPSHRIKAGEMISGHIPAEPIRVIRPETIPIDILYEDNHLIIINKAPGLVVHPSPGHDKGTIVNGILARYPEICNIGEKTRPGIVHRLDRDTSGALIIARSAEVFSAFSTMFADRRIKKKYLALIYGRPKGDKGSILLPIGRHNTNRKRMSINSSKTREAETNWRVLKAFEDVSLLEVTIKTGRTHQIRVHCAASEMPVVGDGTYSARWTKKVAHFKNKAVFKRLKDTSRQMLHAWKLEFTHPVTDAMIKCTAPVTADMKELLRDINRLDRKGPLV